MSNSNNTITAVPTNIITGFLGVGKTSAILNLLRNKPASERWAVLVNEFGEIGIDGSLIDGQQSKTQEVFIREVPGGCMCCAAGLPMQVALNQLLAKAQPDRLLIEPTGLGHPEEVLEVLSSEYYQELLSLQKIVTLVDARKLYSTQYTDHKTFNQQITIADTIIGNKIDLYENDERQKLQEYIAQHCSADTKVIFTQNGELDYSELVGITKAVSHHHHNHHHSHDHEHHDHDHHHHSSQPKPLVSELPMPEAGYLKAENEGENYYSSGWRFAADKVFSRDQLFSFLSGVEAERIKAVFITDQGTRGYNLTSDALSEFPLEDNTESRIEIIHSKIDPAWEDMLFSCLLEASQTA